MSVCVTGATGHIGGTLVRALLADGQRVRALVRQDTRALDGLDVERVTGDLRDRRSLETAFQGVHTVYHLAAVISLASRDNGDVRAINVGGVANVIDACLKRGVSRLLHCSTIHALAPAPVSEPVDEARPLVTHTAAFPYDRSKAEGEALVLDAAQRGLDAVIVNPTGVIGPFDIKPSFMGRFLLDLYHRKMPALTTGGIDWVDVRDVCDGMMAAAARGRTGERYILGGAYQSMTALARMAEDITGVPAPRITVPIWVAGLGVPFITAYARLTGETPKVTRVSLATLRVYHDVSHAKAARELGYHPRPARESLQDAYAWFTDHGTI